MSEETQAAETKPAEEAAEAKTFTQEEVDKIVERRIARVKATPPSDYEELKAKAAKYDEAEEASKSELQKATEERDKWKSRYEELKSESERRDAIAKAAEEYGVDMAMLSRMSGDVEDNARFLKERSESAPKYPTVRDEGEGKAATLTEADIASEKDPAKRVKMRAQLIAQSRR